MAGLTVLLEADVDERAALSRATLTALSWREDLSSRVPLLTASPCRDEDSSSG